MAYVYESIQTGLFSFTIPGEDKTVRLLKGSKVTVNQKLSGSYLRVLRLVEEIPDVVVPGNKQQAKVEDKITKVEEVVETPTESVTVEVTDAVTKIEEPIEESVEQTKKNNNAKKR